MATSHGKDTVFKLDNGAGSLTDISAYLAEAGLDRTVDVAEVQTFGDGSKEILPGLKDGTIPLGGPFDPAVDAILDAAFGAATSKTFEYGPEGSTAGDIKYTGECICTAYSKKGSMTDAARITATLRVTGAVTRTTF